jgi:hypothetical protein
MKSKKASIAVYPHGVSLTGAIFIPWPGLRGHYMKTHACVATVTCPQCGSLPGLPCLGPRGDYKCEVHYRRKDEHAYKLGIRKRPEPKTREARAAGASMDEAVAHRGDCPSLARYPRGGACTCGAFGKPDLPTL